MIILQCLVRRLRLLRPIATGFARVCCLHALVAISIYAGPQLAAKSTRPEVSATVRGADTFEAGDAPMAFDETTVKV